MLNAILEIDGRKIPVVVKTVDRRYGEATEITVVANVNFNVLESRAKTDIERVIFKNPATVVFWKDGTKTVVKCQPGDIYSEETGLALCIAKKYLGNKSNFNNVFKKWVRYDRKFLIEKTCNGCLGAEGLIGHKTNKPHTDGLLASNVGYNVETETGGVWRINLDAKIKYLDQ